jgi:hypothetical protein
MAEVGGDGHGGVNLFNTIDIGTVELGEDGSVSVNGND